MTNIPALLFTNSKDNSSSWSGSPAATLADNGVYFGLFSSMNNVWSLSAGGSLTSMTLIVIEVVTLSGGDPLSMINTSRVNDGFVSKSKTTLRNWTCPLRGSTKNRPAPASKLTVASNRAGPLYCRVNLCVIQFGMVTPPEEERTLKWNLRNINSSVRISSDKTTRQTWPLLVARFDSTIAASNAIDCPIIGAGGTNVNPAFATETGLEL